MLQLVAKYSIASHWAVLLGKEFSFDIKGAPNFDVTGKVHSQVAGKKKSHHTKYHGFADFQLVPTDSHSLRCKGLGVLIPGLHLSQTANFQLRT